MKSISVSELLKISNANIIDIRDHDWYLKDHIPNAKNIPMPELTRDPEQYLKREQQYFIYCEFGYKSKRICELLEKLGYHVIDVKDGYFSYEMLDK